MKKLKRDLTKPEKVEVKKTAVKKAEPKKGLAVSVKLEKDADGKKGRVKVTVILSQDGEEISSDYDFINL